MKNTKRILALLIAAVLVMSMSACEITREGDDNTTVTVDRTYEYVDDEDLEGDDIANLICGEDGEYKLWYADNGDVYAFNGSKQFYFKSGEDVYYGSYMFTTSTSTIYYGLLSMICDNDGSMDESFNVAVDNEDYLLTKASDPNVTIRITKNAPSDESAADVENTDAVVDENTEAVADENTEAAVDESTEAVDEPEESVTDSPANSADVYDVMGLKVYYISMVELIEGETSVLKVSAAPASEVASDDGTVKFEYDSENSVQLDISENANIYMPDANAPSNGTYGCDIYQMRDCLETLGGFYATVIIENDVVEAVQYFHVQ